MPVLLPDAVADIADLEVAYAQLVTRCVAACGVGASRPASPYTSTSLAVRALSSFSQIKRHARLLTTRLVCGAVLTGAGAQQMIGRLTLTHCRVLSAHAQVVYVDGTCRCARTLQGVELRCGTGRRPGGLGMS